MRLPRKAVSLSLAFLIGTSLFAACGDDSGGGSSTTASGGGSGSTTTTGGNAAGEPKFLTFDVSSSVPCEDGNATATMSYTTENIDDVSIKIGDGEFAETAGYGPNETSVVAEIPCSGAGESSIQLRGCNTAQQCADSDQKTVTITA